MTVLTVMRCLVLLFAAASIARGTYAVLSVPGVPANPLGIRGLRRIRMLRSESAVAAVEPVLRWLGARLTGVLPSVWRDRIDRRLVLAGDFLGLWPDEFVALCALSSGVCGGVGLLYSVFTGATPTVAAAGIGLGLLLPIIALLEAQQERSRRVTSGLPAVMDLLVLSLSAGLDMRGALVQVVEKSTQPDHPLIEEISFVLHELNVGKTRKVALTQLASRVDSQELRDFVATAVQAEEKGNPLARVLQIQAQVAIQRRTVRAENAAAKAATKMMLPLLMVFAAILLMLASPMVLTLSETFRET